MDALSLASFCGGAVQEKVNEVAKLQDMFTVIY